MEYKASFVMTVITQFIQPLALFAGIYMLFERFGDVQGWTVFEVFLSYSVIGICAATSKCFARGFDQFDNLIRTAAFDRILVRPRGTVIQVLGSGFDAKRVGHFIQASIVLVIAIVGVDISWDLLRLVMLANMIIGGSLLFVGIYMLQATAAFWTIDGLEFSHIFTHGLQQNAIYPLSIFPRAITVFFTFIIPFATVAYLPLQYMLGKIDGIGWVYAFMPLAGVLFVLPCVGVWRFGVSRYSSAGS